MKNPWPQFTWQAESLAPLLRDIAIAQGRLLGRAAGGDATVRAEFNLDALLRAGLTHFWFVTLPPFDDRKGYYAQLENAQKFRSTAPQRKSPRGAGNAIDLTPWLHWFLTTLHAAIADAEARIERVLGKSRFWLSHRHTPLNPEQFKVLNRLLDGNEPDRGSIPNGISASHYQSVTGVSKATTTRHLADLVAYGCLVRQPGGGRNTRYSIQWTEQAMEKATAK